MFEGAASFAHRAVPRVGSLVVTALMIGIELSWIGFLLYLAYAYVLPLAGSPPPR